MEHQDSQRDSRGLVIAVLFAAAVLAVIAIALMAANHAPAGPAATTANGVKSSGTFRIPGPNAGYETENVSPAAGNVCNGHAVDPGATGCTANGGVIYGKPTQYLNSQGKVAQP
jgi:hypothetical protein